MQTTGERDPIAQDIFARAARLKQAETPFVLATVVWSQRPTSARPGAKAIITADGALFGWVGGSCAQSTVMREALRTLAAGEARLLRLDPESQPEAGDRPGLIVAPLTCHSGGKLEIFLEPFLPRLQLLVIGESPVADALIQLGRVMGYRVVAARSAVAGPALVDADLVLEGRHGDPPLQDLDGVVAGRRTAAVVASMGVYDEEAVAAALRAGCVFVGLVASRRRADVLRDLLPDLGIGDELLERLHAPAGLAIAAAAPEEIAVSILAEIISRKPAFAATLESEPGASPGTGLHTPDSALDPVCGMTVEIAGARHSFEHAGERYYFCCPACRRAFANKPQRYLTPSTPGTAES